MQIAEETASREVNQMMNDSVTRAMSLAGCRMVIIDQIQRCAIWPQIDTPDFRAAICEVHGPETRFISLEDPRVPARYRDRKPREFMSSEELIDHGYTAMSYAEWKAKTLNELFHELGNPPEKGNITAETVRHGMRSCRR